MYSPSAETGGVPGWLTGRSLSATHFVHTPAPSAGAYVAASGVTSAGEYAPAFRCPELAAPSGIAGWDVFYCDSSAHRWKMKNNNGSANTVAGLSDFPSIVTVEDCGATSGASQRCAKIIKASPVVVFGEVTLNTAATQVISTLPFTGSATYSCSGSDLTTPAGVVTFPTYTSGAQATIQETGGNMTDHLRWMCVGY
jgi:hypothetical protein